MLQEKGFQEGIWHNCIYKALIEQEGSCKEGAHVKGQSLNTENN